MTNSEVFPEGKENKIRNPPYKLVGTSLLVILVLVLFLVFMQFRGKFTPKIELTMLAARAGLVMDPGSKVTYNGVEIGKVGKISQVLQDGRPAAKFLLDVYPKYLKLIPANVDAKIEATMCSAASMCRSPRRNTPFRNGSRRRVCRAARRHALTRGR
jgi:phospholipid/cholesterol/gamma-HCH transport system substrate-binding protein